MRSMIILLKQYRKVTNTGYPIEVCSNVNQFKFGSLCPKLFQKHSSACLLFLLMVWCSKFAVWCSNTTLMLIILTSL